MPLAFTNAPLTFAQFQATGRGCADIQTALGFDIDQPDMAGRIYCDTLYIERNADGTYALTINNASWSGEPLETLERHLYEYGQSEGLC